jgi:hypothetical protein
MFLVLPDPYPFVRGTDPDPAPRILQSSSKKGKKKTSIPTVLRLLDDFLSLKNDANASKSNKQKNFEKIFFSVAVLKVHWDILPVEEYGQSHRGPSFFVIFNRKFDVFSKMHFFLISFFS